MALRTARLWGEDVPTIAGRRKSPSGVATNDLIFSARIGSNAEQFPEVLRLYVPLGSVVVDATYGRGVFWRKVNTDSYDLRTFDVATGGDCRSIQMADSSADAVVLDPPYMSGNGRSVHGEHQNFEDYYRNSARFSDDKAQGGPKYHDAVLALYFAAAAEAARVLKTRGVLIVKCQDEVCAGKQRLTHVELINRLTADVYAIEDLFVLVRTNYPGVSRMLRQRHARKNHSYFVVFRRRKRSDEASGSTD